jgi:peptidoglycan DL-endopeptidase CwlO
VSQTRQSILFLALVTILVGVVLPATASGSVLSDKVAELEVVRAQLEELGAEVEKAVERYNQTAAELETVRSRIEENGRLLRETEAALAAATAQFADRADDIYKTQGTELLDVILSVRSFEELVSQVDLMRRLSEADVDLIESIAGYEREIRACRLQLRADERATQELLAERAAHKAAVLASEERMRQVERGLRGEIEELLAEERAAGQALSGIDAGPGYPGVVAIARRYLGVPYVWGGESPSGFDCSGLTMYVYAQVGVQLLHGATAQQRASSPVPLDQLVPGDLVFYGDASYSHHVALYVGGGQVIEAPRAGAVVSYDTVGDAWIGGRF